MCIPFLSKQPTTDQRIVLAGDVWDIDIVIQRLDILQLLAGEYVYADKVGFGLTVLTGRGSALFHDLAGAVLDDDVAARAQTGTRRGSSHGRTGIRRLKAKIFLRTAISVCNHYCLLLCKGMSLGLYSRGQGSHRM